MDRKNGKIKEEIRKIEETVVEVGVPETIKVKIESNQRNSWYLQLFIYRIGYYHWFLVSVEIKIIAVQISKNGKYTATTDHHETYLL